MNKKLLIVILAAAALMRLANLSSGDGIGNDEVFYSFRAIGMLDFDNAPQQTTPLQWQDPNIQWWTRLSFHDHPPLVFLAQNVSMNIFGENKFGFRLPSALLGILSVYLLYLIVKKLFSERTALISAALAAVTVNHVYISRLGLQESGVIFFILLSSYFFLKALENDPDAARVGAPTQRRGKYFLWTGVALGFGLLTKYNVFIMVPIFLSYLALFERRVFKNKKFWLGVGLAILIFSPVIVYNLMLYKEVGHFDFQFSYVLGQDPEVWKSAPGKEAMATFSDRARYFFPYLFTTNSIILIALTILSLLALFKKHGDFVILSLFWMLILISRIGPTYRFLTMLTPFLIISAGIFINKVFELLERKAPKLPIICLAVLLAWETFYALNSVVLNYPIGSAPLLFSRLRYENYNWGYNALSRFIENELAGKFPALTFDSRYQFLEKIKEESLARAKKRGLQPLPALLIYDGNMSSAAQLWIFDRLQIYHGWPVMEAEQYLSLVQEQGVDYFKTAGIKISYFITPTGSVPLKLEDLNGKITDSGNRLEQKLIQTGASPILIENLRNEPVFRVYKF